MARGAIARDQTTPYLIYAFVWRGKTFYMGYSQVGKTRHSGRWKFIAGIHRSLAGNRITEARRHKLAQLLTVRNAQVISYLQSNGLEEYSVEILAEGLGDEWARIEEARLIREHELAGAVLANTLVLRTPTTSDEVLDYLGPKPKPSP